MRETFIPKRFNPRHQQIIDTARTIMARYASIRIRLTLRQLYYQFVAHHGLENSEKSYKTLGTIISDARLAGLLDWEALVDLGRDVMQVQTWDDPAEMLEARAETYREDLWAGQPNAVHVMAEKQAMESVLWPTCAKYGVTFSSNKGYSSSSALYQTGKEMGSLIEDGKTVHVIYLGDHDPSGIDMTRDVRERLALFSGQGYWDEGMRRVYEYSGCAVHVHRVALNMDQIEQYSPPSNPAKISDSRAIKYIDQFGDESWELDALDPEVLAELVQDKIVSLIDWDLWEPAQERETSNRDDLKAMAKTWREEH